MLTAELRRSPTIYETIVRFMLGANNRSVEAIHAMPNITMRRHHRSGFLDKLVGKVPATQDVETCCLLELRGWNRGGGFGIRTDEEFFVCSFSFILRPYELFIRMISFGTN